jgi:hypothetical protein
MKKIKILSGTLLVAALFFTGSASAGGVETWFNNSVIRTVKRVACYYPALKPILGTSAKNILETMKQNPLVKESYDRLENSKKTYLLIEKKQKFGKQIFNEAIAGELETFSGLLRVAIEQFLCVKKPNGRRIERDLDLEKALLLSFEEKKKGKGRRMTFKLLPEDCDFEKAIEASLKYEEETFRDPEAVERLNKSDVKLGTGTKKLSRNCVKPKGKRVISGLGELLQGSRQQEKGIFQKFSVKGKKSKRNIEFYGISDPGQSAAQCGINAIADMKLLTLACSHLKNGRIKNMDEFLGSSLYSKQAFEKEIAGLVRKLKKSRERAAKNLLGGKLFELGANGEKCKLAPDVQEIIREQVNVKKANFLGLGEMIHLNGDEYRLVSFFGFGNSVMGLSSEVTKKLYSYDQIKNDRHFKVICNSILDTGLEIICINLGGHWMTIVFYLMVDRKSGQVVVGPPVVVNSSMIVPQYCVWFVEPMYEAMCEVLQGKCK